VSDHPTISAHPKNHLMSSPPADDPVLTRYRDALYRDRIEHGWKERYLN
jgi:hypothetical protein